MLDTTQHERSYLLPKPPFTSRSTTLSGYFQLLLGGILYPVVALIVRYTQTKYSFPTISCLLVRSITNIIFTIPLLLNLESKQLRLSKKKLITLILSGIVGAAHFLFMYAALFYAPLSIFVTVQSISTPLTAFVCSIFLSEQVRLSESFALLFSTIGVFFIANPQKNDFNTTIGVVLTIISACTTAIWCTLLRSLGEVPVILRVLSLSIFMGLETLCFTNTSHLSAILHDHVSTTIITMSSALAFFVMMSFNSGLKKCRAGPALLVMTLSVPVSFALGWLFLGEAAGTFTLLGAGLVIGSASLVAIQAISDESQW